ncbi:hypothetical protein GJ496_008925 [Pomphorhynchus laevis]|nr:hypothetical protein GJ496_004077 [Pomphorhynchus laevis]KAI0989292.1 hypothetical protein GJ496_008925 [Pomphorhynchus laevis]
MSLLRRICSYSNKYSLTGQFYCHVLIVTKKACTFKTKFKSFRESRYAISCSRDFERDLSDFLYIIVDFHALEIFLLKHPVR